MPDYPQPLPGGGGGGPEASTINEIHTMKGEIAGLDQAVVGLQTKTDSLQTAVNLFTTDEALRNRVRELEPKVTSLEHESTTLKATTDALNTSTSHLLASSTSISQKIWALDKSVTLLKGVATTNVITHRDYLHQLLTLDRDVPLTGTGLATSAFLYLPINSYQENDNKFKATGRFKGYEGRNTICMLFHLVSLPLVFDQAKLKVQDYLNVQFQVMDLATRRVHVQSRVLLNDYVNSESLTFIPMHFVLRQDSDLVVLFSFNTPAGNPFPPEGGLKISKIRTALLHFVPLFAYLGGKVTMKSHPDVEDLLSAPPFEDFAEMAIRCIHHTEPVPPFWVHHRLFVRNISFSLMNMNKVAGTGVTFGVTGGAAYYYAGSNTTISNVGVSKTTNQLIYNISSTNTLGMKQNELHKKFHIFGFVMPEYVYFGLEGYPVWLDINGFNMRPGTVTMSVQVYGFFDRTNHTYGTISDSLPTINMIEAATPTADDLAGFPKLTFFHGATPTAHDCNQLSAFSVVFPSVHDNDHFRGGGPLVNPDGSVNWTTISDQYPASPRYNLGDAPANTAYTSIGVFFCPKDFSGTPLNYLLSDVTIFGFGNDGSEGILGEGIFRSAVTPNGYPPENDDVWFPRGS